MKVQPRVSIIMPTHNANVGFLGEAIDSCMTQTCEGWELIIVDDGSDANSADAIATHAARDQRIRVIRHQFKRCLPAALNTGIKLARGQFLTWLSDDDRFRPTALERMLGFLDTHRSIDIVYTDYSLLHADGRIGNRVRVGAAEDLGIHKPVGICYLAKHAAFATIGFREEFFLAEDLDFWIRAFMKYKVAALHEDLALYRQHAMTLTQTHPRAEVLKVHRRILDRHLPNMHWLDASGRVRAYLRLATGLWNAGARVAAVAALARAARFGPRASRGAIARVIADRHGRHAQAQRP